ncbi:XVIPCD domain-containing protein [Frateuria defendens]|uniref:XVIPCD domain-containing protein n=1 Tax=Frateuria defendens TaxID=2219559 RepID=UPI00066FBB5D|nr:XVIPCD domain-containing protein [Frateuria defendens]
MSIGTAANALLSQDAYKDHALNEVIELGGVKYKIFDHTSNSHTGYQATAYQRVDTGEVVIAHRGTEFDREPVHDGGVDAGMVLTGLNAQAADAMAFTRRVVDEAKRQAERAHYPLAVTVTGHSLGGTLAEISAAKFGLKGETFNAYGAAGLMHGVPEGGNEVIDHVRAGDLVSAASPHFGEVRIYAAQQDIDTLSKAGYRDDSGLLSPRNPIEAVDFKAHAIDNFVPDSKLLGHSIIGPEGEALYRAHQGMIDRYRDDVRDIRTGLSAGWEIPRAAVHGAEALGHAVVSEVEQGAHAVERTAGHIANEAVEAFDALKEKVSHGAQATEHAAKQVADEAVQAYTSARQEISGSLDAAGQAIHKAAEETAQALHAAGHASSEKVSQAWDTLTHPGSWFDSGPLTATSPRLDQAEHPDHPLYRQAQSAVHRLDAEHRRTPDQRSDNFAAALAVAARREGLSRIDHLVLNDDASQAYAVQGELNSPFKRIASVSTQEAMGTSIEKSSAAWAQVALPRQSDQVQVPPLSPSAPLPPSFAPER